MTIKNDLDKIDTFVYKAIGSPDTPIPEELPLIEAWEKLKIILFQPQNIEAIQAKLIRADCSEGKMIASFEVPLSSMTVGTVWHLRLSAR